MVEGDRRISRRDLLALAAGAVVGAGGAAAVATAVTRPPDTARAGSASPTPAAEEPSPPELRRFVSTALTAPAVTVWTRSGATPAPGYLFTTPRTEAFNAVVYDSAGEPVWIEPTGLAATDLRVQQFQGRPVLTYWSGRVYEGHGIGSATILDDAYRPIATVRTGGGVIADLHEFALTARGTALLIGYPPALADLTALDGPEEGHVLGGRVQEIDIATGAVLLDWEALDHVDLDESYQTLGKGADGSSAGAPFDPVHLNSVEDDGDALLVSARHTSAVYRVDKATGEVLWRLGGRRSDYDVEEAAGFSWQHDARRRPDGRISLFDNHGKSGSDGVSAGLILDVDEDARTATVAEALRHEERFGYAMGNLHVLADGSAVVGWGTEPVATEFDPDGEAVFELRDLGRGSYRVWKHEWVGRPATPPDVGVRRSGDRLEVYASWNGATEVARWRVLAGADAGALTEAGSGPRTGFETRIEVPDARAVQVQALDAGGAVLGSSAVRPVPSA
ncbi:arylsulfotransferase family protein [Naasia sp. SYSU D00057]|uniref:arylsulfotransferase family protein n=1 Tax=Naasia sp. SYSU D00057 TaxID=2817380 RepID=UPI001B303279|nr:arylsulfotransferase family protein [Naasia sp. SYSU D00057]